MEAVNCLQFIRDETPLTFWEQREDHAHKKHFFLKFSEKQIPSFNYYRHILESRGPRFHKSTYTHTQLIPAP